MTMMTPNPLDVLAVFALIGLVSGLGGATYRAALLLVQLVSPKPRGVERGAMLVVLATLYILLVGLDVPGVLAALGGGSGRASVVSVARTSILAAWLWTLTTILLMLAKGELGPRPVLRRKA